MFIRSLCNQVINKISLIKSTCMIGLIHIMIKIMFVIITISRCNINYSFLSKRTQRHKAISALAQLSTTQFFMKYVISLILITLADHGNDYPIILCPRTDTWQKRIGTTIVLPVYNDKLSIPCISKGWITAPRLHHSSTCMQDNQGHSWQ